MCVYLASQCLTEAAVFHIGEQQSVATPTHLQRLGQGTQRGYANVILCDVRNGAVCALYGGREQTNAVGCLFEVASRRTLAQPVARWGKGGLRRGVLVGRVQVSVCVVLRVRSRAAPLGISTMVLCVFHERRAGYLIVTGFRVSVARLDARLQREAAEMGTMVVSAIA